MSSIAYYKFSGPKSSYTNMCLTKLGHTNYNIRQIHTIRNTEDPIGHGFVAVSFFNHHTPEESSSIYDYLSKYLNVSHINESSVYLDELREQALSKAPGTKRKFWFDHETYVSPGRVNKD